jgi:chaperonin GroES
MANFRALGRYVIVKQSNSETVSKGGIFIPETAMKESNMGRVVAVGEEVNLPTEMGLKNGQSQTKDLKEGKVVVFHPHSGTKLRLGDEEYVVLGASDIFLVFDEPK